MGLLNLAVGGVVESSALCRRDEDDMSASTSHLVDENLQVMGEIIICPASRFTFFLVVMSELAEDVVSFFHHGENFFKTVLSEERRCGESAFGKVCHCHFRLEPSCHHLSPAGVGLGSLVGDGGVAAKEECKGGSVAFYCYFLYSRCVAGEFESQAVVPCVDALFAFVQAYVCHVGNVRRAFVYDKRDGFVFAFFRCSLLNHQSSAFGSHGSLGSTFAVTECYADAVVSVGQFSRVIERRSLLVSFCAEVGMNGICRLEVSSELAAATLQSTCHAFGVHLCAEQ